MKRILSLILAAVLMGTLLVGCNEKSAGNVTVSQPAGNSQTQPHSEPQTDPEMTVPVDPETLSTPPSVTEPNVTQPDNTVLKTLDFTLNPDAFSDYRVTLTQVATFQNDDISGVSRHMPVIRTTKDGKNVDTLLSFDGQDKLGKSVDNYDYFGDGITAIYTYVDNLPVCELVNINTGKAYLSDGAVKIEKLDDRFYYVIYITEQTMDKNECFFYITDQIIAMGPTENDAMYKGYAKVYDLQKEAFVEDFRVENGSEEVVICEQTLCLKHSYDCFSFYSAEGKLLAEKVEDVCLGEKYIFRDISGVCEIYDSSFNLLGVIEGAAPIQGSDLRYNDRYLKYGEYQSFGVMKITGEKVTGPDYHQISCVFGDYIVCRNADDTVSVVYGDGTTVVQSGTYKLATVPWDSLPAFKLSDAEDQYYLYMFDGQILPLKGISSTNMVCSEMDKTDYSYEYLIYSTGQWVRYEDSSVLTNGLLETEDGIVEVFTGSVLLEPTDYAAATDEYLYICNDGVWTVYAITLSK